MGFSVEQVAGLIANFEARLSELEDQVATALGALESAVANVEQPSWPGYFFWRGYRYYDALLIGPNGSTIGRAITDASSPGAPGIIKKYLKIDQTTEAASYQSVEPNYDDNGKVPDGEIWLPVWDMPGTWVQPD